MRYYYNRKATADASCKLKISNLRKDGMLLSGETTGKISWTSSITRESTTLLLLVDVTDEPFAILVCSVTDREGNKTDYSDKVSLETTPCYFGGERYWFSCPSCWQRVGVLYLAPGDVRFRCRHCNNLSYWSRNRCMTATFGHTSREIDSAGPGEAGPQGRYVDYRPLSGKCRYWEGRLWHERRRLWANCDNHSQRILNPGDTGKWHLVTNCKIGLYIATHFSALPHVSIMALICFISSPLFSLNCTPILTIQ